MIKKVSNKELGSLEKAKKQEGIAGMVIKCKPQL